MQQHGLIKGKNSSDIALIIDAMDVMYAKNIDVICFVSSDCDFTPMVTRALAKRKVVLGFGTLVGLPSPSRVANLHTSSVPFHACRYRLV